MKRPNNKKKELRSNYCFCDPFLVGNMKLTKTFCGILKCCIKLVPPHLGTCTKNRWRSNGTSLDLTSHGMAMDFVCILYPSFVTLKSLYSVLTLTLFGKYKIHPTTFVSSQTNGHDSDKKAITLVSCCK